jgi:hypothetical protein
MRTPLLFAALAACLSISLCLPDALAAQTTPRVQVTDFTVDGNPPPAEYRDLLANAIRPTIAQVEQCYDRRLAVTPTLGGDFRLRLWVSARQVIRATPESSVGDTELEERAPRSGSSRFRPRHPKAARRCASSCASRRRPRAPSPPPSRRRPHPP